MSLSKLGRKIDTTTIRFPSACSRSCNDVKATSSAKKAPALRSLTTRLKGLQTSFDAIHRFVEEFNEEKTASKVLVRLDRLDKLWEQINDTVNELLSHDDFTTDPQTVMDERTVYEIRFYDDKSFLMDKHQ